MSPRTAGWVADILRDAERARQFVGTLSPEELGRDQVRLYGTLHALTLIGEASKRIPIDLRRQFPQIPWKAMAGLRDVIIHQYDELDLAAIHRTVTLDCQMLIEQLPRVLQALKGSTAD